MLTGRQILSTVLHVMVADAAGRGAAYLASEADLPVWAQVAVGMGVSILVYKGTDGFFAKIGGQDIPISSKVADNIIQAQGGDDLLEPKLAKDIVSDPDAVYGYRPKSGSSLDQFDIDWSNADEVAKAQAARIEYLEAMDVKKANLTAEVDNYLSEGKSMADIADIKVEQRNMDRISSYIERGDYENLEKLYERNILEYGRQEGPTVTQLYEKYGSYDEIIYSSVKVNRGMNVILGIEDATYIVTEGAQSVSRIGQVAYVGVKAADYTGVGGNRPENTIPEIEGDEEFENYEEFDKFLKSVTEGEE